MAGAEEQQLSLQDQGLVKKNATAMSGEVGQITPEAKYAKPVGAMRRVGQVPVARVIPEVNMRGAYEHAKTSPGEHLGKKVDTKK